MIRTRALDEPRRIARKPAGCVLAAILFTTPMQSRAEVTALVVHDGSLIAGGEFTSLGGVAVSNVARWDGSQWNALGAGLSGGAVRVLRVHAGRLVAGGSFTATGSEPAAGIAIWDGATW